MAYEQRDLQGALFKNAEKQKDAHPDYRGSCLIAGQKYWIAGWIKEGRNGKPKFMSLAFTKDDPTKRREGSQRQGQREDF